MLQITARLFKHNQLTGYRISDGQQEQDFNKMQAWMFAKQNQIINVKAIGSGDNGDFGLSGTNGFELKSLPQIKLDETRVQEIPQPQEQNNKYDTQDLDAALVHATTNTGGLKNAVKVGAQLGIVIGISDTQGYKNGLQELKKEYFKKRLEDPDFKEKRRTLTSGLMVTHTIRIGDKVVGYTLKNISSMKVPYVRRPLKIAAKETHVLAPHESVDLSRLEVMLTLSLPEYSGRIQNARMTLSSTKMKGNESHTDWLMRGYLINTSSTPLESKQMEVNNTNVKYIANNKTMEAIVKMSEKDSAYISKLADQYAEKGIDTEDIPEIANGMNKVHENHQNTLRTQQEVRQKLKEATSIRGIFNAFKR